MQKNKQNFLLLTSYNGQALTHEKVPLNVAYCHLTRERDDWLINIAVMGVAQGPHTPYSHAFRNTRRVKNTALVCAKPREIE